MQILGVATDDVIQVLKELGGLIAGITAMLIAWAAVKKADRAKEDSSQAKTDSAVAAKVTEVNTQRITNVAQFQDRMQSDMQRVAENSIPVKVAEVLLNATPTKTGGSDGSPQVEETIGGLSKSLPQTPNK